MAFARRFERFSSSSSSLLPFFFFFSFSFSSPSHLLPTPSSNLICTSKALRLAAAKARPEIVAVLLAAGANVRATSKGGMLASHGAAELREKDMGAAVQILQLLLAHDPALLELQTTAGNTPLHYAGAVSDGDATPVWELLEGCGGSATVKNSAGHTPTDKKDKEMAKAVGKMAL